jgi:hypothetical protein
MGTTTRKKKTLREYLAREAVLPDSIIELVLVTVADDYDPRRCLQCSRKRMDNIYWDYLEAKGVADSAESKIDMMVDILTLGWSKGVAILGNGAISKVILAAENDVANASRLLRSLLSSSGTKHTQCCNQ